jgi:hypothetical protein
MLRRVLQAWKIGPDTTGCKEPAFTDLPPAQALHGLVAVLHLSGSAMKTFSSNNWEGQGLSFAAKSCDDSWGMNLPTCIRVRGGQGARRQVFTRRIPSI